VLPVTTRTSRRDCLSHPPGSFLVKAFGSPAAQGRSTDRAPRLARVYSLAYTPSAGSRLATNHRDVSQSPICHLSSVPLALTLAQPGSHEKGQNRYQHISSAHERGLIPAPFSPHSFIFFGHSVGLLISLVFSTSSLNYFYPPYTPLILLFSSTYYSSPVHITVPRLIIFSPASIFFSPL
jgi:hypothetical protein